jgi:hypothetical protein
MERTAHGAAPSAAGEHKRAVDIEQDDVRQTGVSAFRANICRAGTLR